MDAMTGTVIFVVAVVWLRRQGLGWLMWFPIAAGALELLMRVWWR